MNDSASEAPSQLTNDSVDILTGFILLAITAILVYIPVLYRKIRCKFPVTVNCWFCNRNTKVPYNDANSWDCPFCEQYNGFNTDGGYNKVIKEQHSPSRNALFYNPSVKQRNKIDLKKEQVASNGFCKLCNINQQLKVQQLARFVPLYENNYDEEVEQFRQQLEKSYRLCSQCEKTLAETLQKQQYNLLKDRLNIQKEKSQVNNVHSHRDYKFLIIKLRGGVCTGLKLISGIVSFIMFISFTHHLETEQHFLKALPGMFVLDYQPFLQDFLYYLTYSYDLKKELISIGLLCYGLSSFCRQTNYDHPSLLLFWVILYALSWSDMTALQVLVSAVCVLLTVMEIEKSPNYTFKRLLKNSPQEARTEYITEPLPKPPTPPEIMRAYRKSNLNESEELSQYFNESKSEESVTEVSKKESPKPVHLSESQTPQLRNRKAFSKNFLASLDSERIEKEMSPPPEIFQNLSNLHIGSNASEKQSNFLFESHNFEDRCSRKSSSIIKPAKFVKPSTNPWTLGELNETISRSSTPSSGYSSQKPDKLESRQSFNFPKVISPVPYPRSTPPDNFDYWDRGQPFFNAGNFHYFSPSYVPIQQFPNPMGHTTLYTCTRPANYPFTFPASPNQNFPYPPGSQTPRFSDASDTENLFQNASSSLKSNQKWSKIKTVLYNLSVFFNIITTCVLVYFTWSGIISLTRN